MTKPRQAKKKTPKRDPLETEEAIKRVIDQWGAIFVFKDIDGPNILFRFPGQKKFAAILDLRDFVKKRKPLKGVMKKLKKAVR